MNILVLIYVLLFSFSLSSQEYWPRQQSPTRKLLRRIQFVDTLYGWAAGDSGTIIHTSNGGQNWILQNTGIEAYPVDDLFFINRRLGWGLANDYLFHGTKLLYTTNSGQNWEIRIFPDSTVAIFSIYFLDSLNGFAGGNFAGRIFKTTNGGDRWIECTIDTNFCPLVYLFEKKNFSFLNSQTGFVSGGHWDISGLIWRTTDGGANWLTYCVSPEPVERIKAVSETKVMATGGDPEFGASTVQSYDGGAHWIYDMLGPHDDTSFSGIGSALAYRTPAELWVPLSIGSAWGVSLDSGNKITPWIHVLTPDSVKIYDALFVTSTFGWACGDTGTLFKYNPAIIGLTELRRNYPDKFALYQNYPNPFNPVTTITYYLPLKSYVQIRVYDILGRQVLNSEQGLKQAGLNSFIFSSGGYASGVYFYRIDAGDWTESKKMVLLK